MPGMPPRHRHHSWVLLRLRLLLLGWQWCHRAPRRAHRRRCRLPCKAARLRALGRGLAEQQVLGGHTLAAALAGQRRAAAVSHGVVAAGATGEEPPA